MSRFLNVVESDSKLLDRALEPVKLDGGYPVPSVLTRSIEDVKNFVDKGPPFTLDDIPAFVDAAKNLTTVGLDDRKFLLEKLLTLMARLPNDSQFSTTLQHYVIDILYKDLPHPPSGYLSLPAPAATTQRAPNSRVKYAFRAADGSNYNPLMPSFGAARMPYARSVPSLSSTPTSALPDAGLVFDTLLRRPPGPEGFTPHPDGISSLFFAFADLVIHCIFNTDHADYTVNDVSSYLDMSVLYGSSDKDVDSVRRKDGTGRLWDDVFADSRVLFMPPSVCALLVLLSRNHNFVAEKILNINERGNFKDPASLAADATAAQDEEIFQRTRLVNCALFMKIILGDYVGAILGLVRDGLSWRLDPLSTIRELGHEFAPRGEGNWSAAAFQARGTPEVLRVIEMLGIEQARSWGACTLNEFRQFMSLKPYANFKEWNPDPTVHNAAEALYGHIDNLELHVGMQAEQAKVPMPGAGLCPGYTISRAILADAVCLTRGDRFLTVDCTPFNLTAWGYQDVQYDDSDGSYGGMLTKLLFRTLPEYYPAGSAYAHFPFLVPSLFKKKLAAKPGSIVDKYVWTRPPVPKPSVVVDGYTAVSAVLGEPKVFESGYDVKIGQITRGVFLYKPVIQKILFSDQNISAWTHCFQCTTGRLIKQKSVSHVGSELKYVDIVKDVINLLPIYWLADEIIGLNMKSKLNPHGVYRDQEVYDAFAVVANYVVMNTEPVDDWTLRQNALGVADDFSGLIKGHLTRLSESILSVSGMTDTVLGLLAGYNNHENSDAFLKQLLAMRRTHPPGQIAASLFAEVVPTAAIYSKAIAHIVNFYLDDSRAKERANIVALAGERTEDASKKIMVYAREAIRLDPPISGIVRKATVDTRLGTTPISAGDQVVASVIDANLDMKTFAPNPKKAAFDRTPVDPYGLMGVGPHGMLQGQFFENTVPTVLGTIFSLTDLKRAPGQSGQLNRHVFPKAIEFGS
ncbi:hypothetical protein HWV62_18532 [Athelia sp. TMB]|nr:hypothetical protein HWV62_18532 [Athelia sp. TMB]